MTGELLSSAIRNNAEWCSFICGSHGDPGRFGFAAWCCPRPAPEYYPNVVTLRDDCGQAQVEQVRALRHLSGAWGVKDSFSNLDLSPLGFRRAIVGTWVRYDAPTRAADLEWRPVQSVVELARWEQAWGGDAHRGHARIFMPALVESPDLRVLAGFREGRLVAGGILMRAASVVGLTNIFTSPEGDEGLAAALLREAHRFADGAPLVGWETEPAARGSSLGPLQVWLRQRG